MDVPSEGLPSDVGPHDCSDLILHHHSRHWTTSFHCVADGRTVAQIWFVSNEITPHLVSFWR